MKRLLIWLIPLAIFAGTLAPTTIVAAAGSANSQLGFQVVAGEEPAPTPDPDVSDDPTISGPVTVYPTTTSRPNPLGQFGSRYSWGLLFLGVSLLGVIGGTWLGTHLNKTREVRYD